MNKIFNIHSNFIAAKNCVNLSYSNINILLTNLSCSWSVSVRALLFREPGIFFGGAPFVRKEFVRKLVFGEVLSEKTLSENSGLCQKRKLTENGI
jgi:hypothetical protein